jgi:quercetin dioxygenase-like cupin family protein
MMLESAAMRRMLALVLVAFSIIVVSATTEVEITSEPSHHLALENEFLRVFKVEVAPHAATLMHRHRHDYLFVTLGDSHVSNEVEGKPAVELTLANGDTRFVAGDFAHIARNLAETPFCNITIEILQDEKLRAGPPLWKEENGEKTFAGGRNKILFVKDGVRVSEVDLDAGAIMPTHHHDRAHLLIAITDLELLSDEEGRTPLPLKFKVGDIEWVAGESTHALTNTGNRAARFVTVEFP